MEYSKIYARYDENKFKKLWIIAGPVIIPVLLCILYWAQYRWDPFYNNKTDYIITGFFRDFTILYLICYLAMVFLRQFKISFFVMKWSIKSEKVIIKRGKKTFVFSNSKKTIVKYCSIKTIKIIEGGKKINLRFFAKKSDLKNIFKKNTKFKIEQ